MGRIKKHFKNGFGIESVKDLVEIIVGVLEIVGVIATVWSVVLVYDTLVEMRIEREHTYRPNVCVIEEQYFFPAAYPFSAENNEDTEQIAYGDERQIALEIRNIGVGAAENVRINVLEEDCLRFIDEFNETTSYSKVQYYDRKENIWGNDLVDFTDGGCWDFFFLDEDAFFPYILPNAEQKCEYLLPSAYACVVNAVIIEKQELGYSEWDTINVPDLPITMEYRDVQGVEYIENAVIRTDIMWVFGVGFELTISIIPTSV